MPLWIFSTLLAVFSIAALGAAIWLLLHLNALTHLFDGKAGITAAPARPRVSARSIWIALAVFNAGWLASLAIWILGMTGIANALVVSS